MICHHLRNKELPKVVIIWNGCIHSRLYTLTAIWEEPYRSNINQVISSLASPCTLLSNWGGDPFSNKSCPCDLPYHSACSHLQIQQDISRRGQDLTYESVQFCNFYSSHTRKLQMNINIIYRFFTGTDEGKWEFFRLAALAVFIVYSSNSPHHFTIAFFSSFGGRGSIYIEMFTLI